MVFSIAHEKQFLRQMRKFASVPEPEATPRQPQGAPPRRGGGIDGLQDESRRSGIRIWSTGGSASLLKKFAVSSAL